MRKRIWTVADIQQRGVSKPYRTKSDAELTVIKQLTKDETRDFLAHDPDEAAKLPDNIEGSRYYIIRGLKKGKIGGGEFHRLRQEILYVTQGAVRWKMYDILGGTITTSQDSTTTIQVPPYILHEYEVVEDNTVILVICNTTFDADVKQTQDTYSAIEFQQLITS